MKTYIINFNPLVLPNHEIVSFLDSQINFRNWCVLFAGTILIVSNQNNSAISNILSQRFNSANFLVTEANVYNTDGRLPSEIWDFVNNPKSSGKWEQIIALMNNSNSPNNGQLNFNH